MKTRPVAKQRPGPANKQAGVVKGKGSMASKPGKEAWASFPDSKRSTEAGAITEFVLKPSTSAALSLEKYFQIFEGVELGSLAGTLEKSIKKVQGGDLKECEAMLMGQAHALQGIFMNLSRRAMNSELMAHFETYLRIAMRAQSQCRATLETLATLKNPQVVFARQANIANGPQQVNNGAVLAAPAPARDIEPQQNELLEAQNVERLDPSTKSKAGGCNQKVEAMGTVNGTTHR